VLEHTDEGVPNLTIQLILRLGVAPLLAIPGTVPKTSNLLRRS